MKDAAFTFASLVEPLRADEFMSTYWGRREWLHHGRRDRFEWLLSWRILNGLIRDQRPTAPRFRLMKLGAPVPESAYHRVVQTLRGPLRLLDSARLLAELRGGASLVWDAIDLGHSPIRSAKHAVERSLNAFAFINMYASWGTVSGSGPHWDDHDLFVLQITGRKRWLVHPPSRKWPLPEDFRGAPPAKYEHSRTLKPGSVFYLPRGWWHYAIPLNEPSLHLTIGVLRPTNADFLRWLLSKATESDLVRQDFPFPMDRAARAAHSSALRSVLQKWIRPENLELFAREEEQRHYLDPRPSLQAVGEPHADAWEPDAEVLLLSTRARVKKQGKEVVLLVAEREWRLPKDAQTLLCALVDGQPVRIGSLLQHVPAPIVSDLVTAGVLALI